MSPPTAGEPCGCKGLTDRRTGLLIQCALHQAEWAALHARAHAERNGNITLADTAQTASA